VREECIERLNQSFEYAKKHRQLFIEKHRKECVVDFEKELSTRLPGYSFSSCIFCKKKNSVNTFAPQVDCGHSTCLACAINYSTLVDGKLVYKCPSCFTIAILKVSDISKTTIGDNPVEMSKVVDLK
jgi:hypothetical protein